MNENNVTPRRTTWEYKVVLVNEASEILADGETLDGYGAVGWELVVVTPETDERYGAAYFKRRLDVDEASVSSSS
jgi:hypothetical protein